MQDCNCDSQLFIIFDQLYNKPNLEFIINLIKNL